MQEVFLTVLVARERLTGTYPSALLYRIAINLCLNRIQEERQQGSGREIRLGIPGEAAWECPWGIKREEVEVSWGSRSISVPTNYWEGWTGAQRERDFVLNLSGVRLLLGVYVRL